MFNLTPKPVSPARALTGGLLMMVGGALMGWAYAQLRAPQEVL